MKLHSQGLQPLPEIRAYVAATQAADFEINGRDDADDFVRETVRHFWLPPLAYFLPTILEPERFRVNPIIKCQNATSKRQP